MIKGNINLLKFTRITVFKIPNVLSVFFLRKHFNLIPLSNHDNKMLSWAELHVVKRRLKWTNTWHSYSVTCVVLMSRETYQNKETEEDAHKWRCNFQRIVLNIKMDTAFVGNASELNPILSVFFPPNIDRRTQLAIYSCVS